MERFGGGVFGMEGRNGGLGEERGSMEELRGDAAVDVAVLLGDCRGGVTGGRAARGSFEGVDVGGGMILL